MRRLMRRFSVLAVTGLLAGLVIAGLGVPYGRWNPEALAELYHGPTDTTGTVHLALDCDPFTAGTQSHCAVFASGISMAVTVGNSTGASASVAAFNFRVTNNRQDLFDPAMGLDSDLNSNPDFNDAAAPSGWSCGPPFFPVPERDENPNPSVSVSYIACSDTNPTAANAISLPDGISHVKLATVVFTGAGPIGPEQVATFTLSDVNVSDDTFTELMSCNPVNTLAGPCFGATVNWGLPPPPTFPPSPTPTATPIPDTDADGVPNASDNCPNDPNPGQQNTDGNFISNAPVYTVHDATRARSDNMGDACDEDRDNDGVLNDTETLPCLTSTGPTDPVVFDTDVDRAFDGAECTFGTNPMDPGSKPFPPTTCGATTDMDLDGLSERLERCGYNTNPNVADTDGDGVKDGCEAGSLNPDNVVNIADRGLLAAEIMRPVPASLKLVNFDINKDGGYNIADSGIQAGRAGMCP